LDQESGNNARQLILVKENVVVSRLARAEQACVAVEVVISFDWAYDIGVYNRARATIPESLVTVALGTREKDNFVGFGDDNKGDRGAEIESCTCIYGFAVVSRREISLGARTRGKGGKGWDGLRMRLSSSLITVLNSPSDTPSWETFVMLGHDIGQKTWNY
jgi:hypothetical protein